MRAEGRRELNPLRFSPRESGRQTVERKVIEANLVEKLQARANFLENFVRDFHVSLGELQRGKENARFFDGELANLGDSFSRDADGASFGAQASSATIRASGIPAEAAKENADVQLVLLALQPGEKTFYAFVIVFGIAFKNQAALFGRELTPRHVRGNSAASRPFFDFLKERAIAWLRPRFDGTVVERLAGVGDNEIQIEIDGVSEALATRTRSVRVVEGEQTGLGLLVQRAVILAFEAGAKRKSVVPGRATKYVWRFRRDCPGELPPRT